MTPTPRDRLRLETGWRFRRVAPDEVDRALDYVPWPALGEAQDGKDADARPEQVRHERSDTGLRPWILPSANPFVRDPAAHARRPAQAPPARPDAADPWFDDGAWQQVTVPHDWAIAGPFLTEGPHGGMGRLESWGVGWYRRELEIPAEDAGRSIHLEVDGAMSYASVWLNGVLVGGWPYGYNSWRLDLTPHVVPGRRNLLAIRLDNPPRSARWYPGGGLFRDVRLVRTSPVAVAHWGTRITTPEVSEEAALVEVEVTVENAAPVENAVSVGRAATTPCEVVVTTELVGLTDDGEPDGPPVARTQPVRLDIAPGGSATATASARLERPALWGPPPTQHPHRYLAVTTVRRGEEIVDRYETPFGVRRIEFDADEGLLVNGERIRIQGVNNHHDLGALGAAFHVRAAERQLGILQEMGTNALRTAHNPPAPELLDLTDRMGILVLDEVFDSWYARKTDLDFHLLFEDWHEADLRAMIRRDRHHPSVILWGIGNEVGEQYTGQEGAAVARRLVEIAHQEDPTRLTTTAMNYARPHMPLPAEVDVIGINYQGEGIRQEPEFEGTDRIRTPPQYGPFREAFPRTPILGSETASALSTRGTYLFPVAEGQSGPARDGRGADDATCTVSAYELHAVDFGSTADKVFASLERHPFVAGEFVWTGFDYLGEPTPYYSARSSYTGIVDLAGFPKDRFWLYRAHWRPEVPTAHLLPHWTWPGREGEVTPVHVFTSGDEAELFVNGTSRGWRRKEAGQFRLRWDDVVYAPGEVRVQAYRDGAPWAEDSVRTAGAPARLDLAVDRERITADGRDLAFVTARVLDADGNEVPTASDLLRFAVVGPGRLVATDNGDPTDMTAFPSPERRLFSGRALAIVAGAQGAADAQGADGAVRVAVSADGVQGAEVRIMLAQRSQREDGRTN
jgi:beta-galactosidase